MVVSSDGRSPTIFSRRQYVLKTAESGETGSVEER